MTTFLNLKLGTLLLISWIKRAVSFIRTSSLKILTTKGSCFVPVNGCLVGMMHGWPPIIWTPPKYFVTKVQMIQQKVINDASLSDVTSGPVTDTNTAKSNILLSVFKKLSDGDVKPHVRQSTLLDPMSSRLVCERDCLLPVISTIINKSLQNGDFPDRVATVLENPGKSWNWGKNF